MMMKRKTLPKNNTMIDKETDDFIDFMLAIDLCPRTLNQMRS